MEFVVPRQVLKLGDPSRRSCDACESFGARFKKLIKERTCRRSIKHGKTVHNGKGTKCWYTSFLKGYIEQAFARLNASERLSHGPENEKYLQRADYMRTAGGRDRLRWKKWREQDPGESSPLRPRNMTESLDELMQQNNHGS